MEEGELPDRSAKGRKVEKENRKSHKEKECNRLREEFEVGGFMAQKVVEHRQKENGRRQRSVA